MLIKHVYKQWITMLKEMRIAMIVNIPVHLTYFTI